MATVTQRGTVANLQEVFAATFHAAQWADAHGRAMPAQPHGSLELNPLERTLNSPTTSHIAKALAGREWPWGLLRDALEVLGHPLGEVLHVGQIVEHGLHRPIDRHRLAHPAHTRDHILLSPADPLTFASRPYRQVRNCPAILFLESRVTQAINLARGSLSSGSGPSPPMS